MTMLLIFLVLAQDAPQKHSISGTVREIGTGTPVEADVTIDRAPARRVEISTDRQGGYTAKDLEPGRYRISVMAKSSQGFGATAARIVVLGNQDLSGIDIELRTKGSISGTIRDQNDEPVTDINVFLIAREYSLGELRYVFAGSTTTNDAGEYTIQSVDPLRGYLLLAERRVFRLDGISESPENPKLRRRAVLPTFYPGTPGVDGAQPISIPPGERKESVDVRLQRSPSFCIDGTVERSGAGGTLRFEIAPRRLTSGASGNGAMFIMSPVGMPAADGKIRICDLAPGEYLLTATQEKGDEVPLRGSMPVVVGDRDVNRVSITPGAHVPMRGEIVWSGSGEDVSSKITVALTPMTRAPYSKEFESLNKTSAIPGEISWDALIADAYTVQVRPLPRGVYIKDILYGGHSVMNLPLRVGSVSDSTLRIVLANDGGTVNAKVTDKNGSALPDRYVLLLPQAASSEAALAATLISVQTDQNGACSSGVLAPGKYFVLAVSNRIDMTPEAIAKLWNSRASAKEIEIAPRATVQITLEQ